VFLTCFGVSVAFCCVPNGFSGGWEWPLGFGEHQVGFGWFWNASMVLGNFLPVLLVMPFLGGLFLTCFGVSVGFRCVFRGHHGGKG